MEKLIEILEEFHPDVCFEDEDDLIGDGILTSFDIVELIVRIEEEFDVSIKAQYIVPENFCSAQNIWALIEKLGEED